MGLSAYYLGDTSALAYIGQAQEYGQLGQASEANRLQEEVAVLCAALGADELGV